MAVQVRVAFAALLVLGLAPAGAMVPLGAAGRDDVDGGGGLLPARAAAVTHAVEPRRADHRRARSHNVPHPAGVRRDPSTDRTGQRAGDGARPSCSDESPCGLALTPQVIDPTSAGAGAGRTARCRSRADTGRAGWRFGNEKEVDDVIRAGK